MPDSEYDPDPRWAPGQGLGKYLTNTGEDMWDLIKQLGPGISAAGRFLDNGGASGKVAQDARAKMAAIANAVLPEAVSKFPSNVANIASTAVNDPARFGRAASALAGEVNPLDAMARIYNGYAQDPRYMPTGADMLTVGSAGMRPNPGSLPGAALSQPGLSIGGRPVGQTAMQSPSPGPVPTPSVQSLAAQSMPSPASPQGAFGPAPASSPVSASAPPLSADINTAAPRMPTPPGALVPNQFAAPRSRYGTGSGLDTGSGPAIPPSPLPSTLATLTRGSPTLPASDTSRIGVTQGARGAPIGRDLRTGKFISASDPRVKSQIQRMQAAAMQTATTPEEEK